MKRGFYEFPGRSKRQIYSVGAPRWFNPHRFGTVEAWYRSDAWTVDSRGFPFIGQIFDLSGNGKHLSYFVESGQPVGLGIWDKNTYRGIPSFALFHAAYVNSNVTIAVDSHRAIAIVFIPTLSNYRSFNQFPISLGNANYRATSGDSNAFCVFYQPNLSTAGVYTLNPNHTLTQSAINFSTQVPNVWICQWNGAHLQLMQNGGAVAQLAVSSFGTAGPYLSLGSYINLAYNYIPALFVFEVIVWSSSVNMSEINTILQRQYRTGRV